MRRARNPVERGFDAYDRGRLIRALGRIADARTYRRVQAVLFVAQGRRIEEVAQDVLVKPWAVYAWIRKYLHTHDPDQLTERPRSGRPRAAPVITNGRIVRQFRRDPMRLGYTSTGWTVALLAEQLRRRYGCSIGTRTLRRRMHQIGLCWKRPRYVYATKDPHRAQKKGASFVG